ncbi:tRNA1(Val) (adenine(37)-N6)-methyltransferase [Caldalkalibacillus mannanilyticus]|uniref:tRNA1(Val) (adenine(37)-N6)-methyltransferase n=1 Tax=Caldalkalibacillus mannanilyticus TaxID=1418 RepID=UPI000468B677|nr:tRNA1(Val) (adenine(37)-N6)-methyltransferase [Caldalkalibacillus mannanilyticus]
MEVKLQQNERMDYLLTNDLKIIQSPEVFSFSMDAVLLAKFASIPLTKGRMMDLCTGNGVIPLLLSARSKAKIEAVEIQDRLFDMANRSVALNQLQDQITIHHMDLKEAPQKIGHGLFDYLTCNPPYMPVVTGEHHQNEHYAIARHEIMCSLEDVIKVSAQLLRPGGKACYVHRPNRLMDILTLMRQYRLEPKRLRFVHPKRHKEANMVLVEGMKDAQPDLKLLPPLVVYDDHNEYTSELQEIYFGAPKHE